MISGIKFTSDIEEVQAEDTNADDRSIEEIIDSFFTELGKAIKKKIKSITEED